MKRSIIILGLIFINLLLVNTTYAKSLTIDVSNLTSKTLQYPKILCMNSDGSELSATSLSELPTQTGVQAPQVQCPPSDKSSSAPYLSLSYQIAGTKASTCGNLDIDKASDGETITFTIAEQKEGKSTIYTCDMQPR